MQVEYKLKLGQEEFTLKTEVQNEIEFFQKMAFYSGLPKTGPNGENDLKLVHRTTKKGDYYSIVSVSAGQEYRLGILKEGGLFPKGWAPIYGTSEDAEETATSTAQATVASVETQIAAATAAPKAAAATATAAPKAAAPAAAAPKAAPAQRSTADIINQYAVGNTATKPAAASAAPATAPATGNVNSLLRR
jgi:hypothetical protein